MKWGHRAVLLGAIFLFLMQSGCTMFIAKRAFKAIKAGVNNYVVKPFTADTLGEKIKQTLAKMGVAV